MGTGGILFFELAEPWEAAYVNFRDQLTLFKTGTGMACVTSMVAQPFSGSHASMSNDEKYAMGITTSLVRLCFGLEDENDLKNDLLAAIKSCEMISGKGQRVEAEPSSLR